MWSTYSSDTQVAVGEYQVQMHFTESGLVTPAPRPPWISIESSASVTDSDRKAVTFEAAPDLGRALIGQLGRTITKATGHTDGTLTLRWDDDSVVEVLDSSERYESYQIGHGDLYIVV